MIYTPLGKGTFIIVLLAKLRKNVYFCTKFKVKDYVFSKKNKEIPSVIIVGGSNMGGVFDTSSRDSIERDKFL